MARVIIVGDGPGGLSAALFLAKNGQDVTVFGLDKTALHWAYLHNYLGVPDTAGSDFQAIARQQVLDQGAAIVAEEVTAVAAGFTVTTDSGTHDADYLVLTEGKNPALALSLGVDVDQTGAVVVDRNGATSIPRLYVMGRAARPGRSQAIISAGDGAAAALDILAWEAGKDVQDWDSPPKDEA